MNPVDTIEPAGGASAPPFDDDDDVVVLSWWQRPINIVALLVAMALVAGMIGWLIGDITSERSGNDADIGFLEDMRTHHEQAVEMALIFLTRPDTDPALRNVARSIMLGQSQETGRMVQLLTDLDAPENEDPDQAMAWMGMAMPASEMPGMATEEQIDELSAADGSAADELFVDLMVAHHQGGSEMADYAAEAAADDDVRSFAASMAVGQADEIIELQQLVD